MRDGKFGVGIIGCGGIAVSHFQTYSSLSGECEIIAISDVSEAAARRYADEYKVAGYYADWQELLADERIEVVSICTPHGLHAPMTVAAARAGKHVVCEKPMCVTVGQAHEMREACRENNVKLSIGSERFNPRHRFIKEKVMPELGEIGFSHAINFFYRANSYYSSAAWRGTWAMEGGAVCANQATYVWDQWQSLLGGVDYAYGYWANLLHPEIEAEDIGYGLVKFRNGSFGKFLATSCCEWQSELGGLQIDGARGSIWARDPWGYEIGFTLQDARLDAMLHAEFQKVIDADYHGRFQPWQIQDIFAAIREDRETLVPEAMDAIKILNGLHWNGWAQSEAFKCWAGSFDLPATVEAGKEAQWNGGRVIQKLAALVKQPTHYLETPFLGPAGEVISPQKTELLAV